MWLGLVAGPPFVVGVDRGLIGFDRGPGCLKCFLWFYAQFGVAFAFINCPVQISRDLSLGSWKRYFVGSLCFVFVLGLATTTYTTAGLLLRDLLHRRPTECQ